MFKTLALKDQHAGCTRCNYIGCTWTRERYPVVGHWLWTIELAYRWFKRTFSYWRLWEYITRLDYSKIEDVEIDGIDTRDYPDFVDAFVASATYKGRAMSDSELDRLNQDSDFVYEQVQRHIY